MNTPEAHRAEIPAANGIATARDLAHLYACLGAGGTLDAVTLLRPETVRAATERQTFRPDEVLFLPLGWALGSYAFTRYKKAKRLPATLVRPTKADRAEVE